MTLHPQIRGRRAGLWQGLLSYLGQRLVVAVSPVIAVIVGAGAAGCDPGSVSPGAPREHEIRVGERTIDIVIWGSPTGSPPTPVFLFHPGFSATASMYSELAADIARGGYVVIGIEHGETQLDSAHQALRVLDWLDSEHSPLRGRVDSRRVGIGGHSMGGKLAMLAAALDGQGKRRVRAVVAWDPVDVTGAPGAPPTAQAPSVAPERMADIDAALLIYAAPAARCSPEGENHAAFWDAARRDVPTARVLFPQADHVDWVDFDFLGMGHAVGQITDWVSGALCGRSGEPAAKRQVHRVTGKGTRAWLDAFVRGQPLRVDDVLHDTAGAGAASLHVQSHNLVIP